MTLKNTEEKTEILYQKNMRKIKCLLFIFYVPSVCRQDISCLKKSLEIKEEEKTPLRIKKKQRSLTKRGLPLKFSVFLSVSKG